MRSTHSDRLERWLGRESVEEISASMRGWYGPPIAVSGVPGRVWACGDGDFRGPIASGGFATSLDYVEDRLRRRFRRWTERQLASCNVGFSGLADLFTEARAGKLNQYMFYKSNSGASGRSSSLWRQGPIPPVGSAPANAPGGTAFNSSSTGAIPLVNPGGTDTQHFVRTEYANQNTNIPGQLLLFDLIFGVNKTMNSTATEAVTGVPTRYQSTTPGAEDWASGNFLFVQVGGTVLPATAHNWTVCQYTDQNNNATITLPTITGVSAAAVDSFDHAAGSGIWFAPLAAGDSGIKALTQMQCSAAVATGVIWFMMGHPIAFFPNPLACHLAAMDGVLTSHTMTRIFDNACLAFLDVNRTSASGNNIGGVVYTVAG